MFCAPHWHGATQTHFPPKQRKSQWHLIHLIIPLASDTPRLRQRVSHQGPANPNGTAISRTYFGHTVCPHTRSTHINTANDPAHQPHAAFTPVCFALPSGPLPRKHTSHQSRTNPNGTATSRTYFGHTSRSSGSFPHYFCTTNWPLLSPAPKTSFPYYFCATNWPLLSPAPKSSFPYYMCTTNSPLLTPAPKTSFPYYFCTTNWPLLSPASSFPRYICTTNWPLLTPAPKSF